MNSPLLDAYKQGTKEYEIAMSNYEYGFQEGKKEAIKWVRKLIKIFWKDWNLTKHKKLSYFAFNELDETILEEADETNGRIFMERTKTMSNHNIYKDLWEW